MSSTSYDLISEEALGYPVSPSESIYFGKFPYRIKFTLPQVEPLVDEPVSGTNRRIRHQSTEFKNQLHDFIYDFKIDARTMMPAWWSNTHNMYLTNIHDLNQACSIFGPYVTEIYGPLSESHVELLTDPNFSVVARKQYYYNVYDTKIECFASMFQFGSTAIAREEIQNLMEFLKENTEEDEVRFDSAYYASTLYTNYTTFLDILPFVKLSYPGVKLKIVRCVLKDK